MPRLESKTWLEVARKGLRLTTQFWLVGHGNEDEDSLPAELGPSRLVGGLILRGNKCVLIRSLSGEWEGMRLPWGASNIEPGARAAVQIVSELCEIEEEEVTILEIAPVTIAVPGMPILLHALYAANPPPAGSAADSDCEDPEDVYDWCFGEAVAGCKMLETGPHVLCEGMKPSLVGLLFNDRFGRCFE